VDVVEDRRWLASCNPRVALMGTLNPGGAKVCHVRAFGSAGVAVGKDTGKTSSPITINPTFMCAWMRTLSG
jgi:hypothetical protein